MNSEESKAPLEEIRAGSTGQRAACKVCDHRFPRRALTCPNCGHPAPRFSFLLLSAIIVMVVLALTVSLILGEVRHLEAIVENGLRTLRDLER